MGEVSEGVGEVPEDVLLLTKKRTFFHKKTTACSLLKKTKQKNPPKKFPLCPNTLKMMVLLLYIQNQDRKKNDQKISNSQKNKKILNPTTTQNKPQKIPQQLQKNFATHNFFLQVMNKIKKK